MIHNLELTNLRGIGSVSFEDLGRVNLIIGGNNTGKTSVLEGLTLLFGSHPQLERLPTLFRQSANAQDNWTNFWPTLVRNQDYEHFNLKTDTVMVTGQVTNNEAFLARRLYDIDSSSHDPNLDGRNAIIRIPGKNNGNVNAGHSTPTRKLSVLSTVQPDPKQTSALFNEIAPLNPENETKLEELLRVAIEPRLKRLRYAKLKGTQEHLIYADLGSGPMIPFTQMGQAFARVLHIYCELFSVQPDILLVDEIENGLYYDGLQDFWKGLFTVLRDQDIQLFATTHSKECMETAQKADAQLDGSDLRFLRLDRHVDDLNNIIGTCFNSATMAEAMEVGQEMR